MAYGWQHASLVDELDHATETLEAAGTVVDVEGHWKLDMAPSVETVMALALREAATNIVRHSQAQRVRLRIDAPDTGVRLVVSDDGIGYRGAEGAGLRGMRERVVAAGGTMELANSQGTTLTIDMPFGGRAP